MDTTLRRHLDRTVAAAAVASAVAVPALVLAASPAQAAGCYVWANTPTVSAHDIGERGGRTDCSNVATVYVRLKWDRPWSPDPTLDSRSGQYQNVALLVDARCLVGTHAYYIDTDAGSSHATSNPRKTVNCG